MKKYLFIGIIVFAFILTLPAVAKSEDAGPKGIHEPGTGLDNPELKEQNRGTGLGVTSSEVIETEEVEDVEEEVTSSKDNVPGQNSMALERRSQVANAVQEMLNATEKIEGGIGEKVREIAQNQNQIHENIEMKLEQIKNQNRFFRFLFGSKAKDVEELKNQIKTNQEKIVELKNTVGEMTDEQVKARLETQINTLEQVKTQIETETIEETSDFSLFGWVKNLFK